MKYYPTAADFEANPDAALDVVKERMAIKAEYDSHDCHASPEDGCKACAEYQQIIEEENALAKSGMCFDRHGTCEPGEKCDCSKVSI